ncbi:MAG TPA: anaerobic glycerol-3-phosphate dehydrogenase subunit B [Anaerolineae bacterium]|nr:anaerobic glycerol-3-phosphate dehydrogenase subunit B [Anaerolineae bacterium]
MTEIIVIGAGLTGLFASILAADRGAKVTLVTRGRGGLTLSHGCIDVWERSTPSRALSRLRSNHPYRRAGLGSLQAGLEFLQALGRQANYPFIGSISRNLRLPTALGAIHTTAIAPHSLALGDLRDNTPIVIAGVDGLRDFFPELVAANLRRAGIAIDESFQLPLPMPPTQRDRYSIDLARSFEDPDFRGEVARIWKPRLSGIKRLGIPAVLGFKNSQLVHEEIQERLGVTLFEIPTLPPSLPGLRLESLLHRKAMELGVFVIEGPKVVGRVDGSTTAPRVSGVVLQTVGGPRTLTADIVLLATGGVLHGGLVFQQDGQVRESVLDLPVIYIEGRAQWTVPSPLDAQPYASFGLSVNDHMQPLGADGLPIYSNLYCAGGLIAGADRSEEGSRQGIDIATAYRAIEVALG